MIIMKRTLRMLYITLFEPKKVDMKYLISTTGSIDKFPDETARMLGFKSFAAFAKYMWPFDAPTYIRKISTHIFCVERNSKQQIAILTYTDGIAEIPFNRYYVEAPILIPITDSRSIESIVSLATSKTI